MTKEQEAIKNIKIYIHDRINESVDEDGYERYAIDEWDKEFINAIETVLSMLKEKDREIVELKQALARNIAKNFTSSMKESAKSKEDLEMLNKGWQIELEKKDKQINLIINAVYKRFKAELLLEYGFENEEQFKQYFERKSEE